MWNPWQQFKSYYFLSDEMMGKKDDDHRTTPPLLSQSGPHPNGSWRPSRVGPRRAMKRFLLLAVFVVVAYYFFSNLPSDFDIEDYKPQLPPFPHEPHEVYDYVMNPAPKPKAKPASSPSHDHSKKKDKKKGSTAQGGPETKFDGPLKFHNLAASLHAISGTRGGMFINKNVLFSASSLRSAAALLPLACAMGAEYRSYVHFALMSRSEIDMDELKKINGVANDCEIIFHDARPDFAPISTDARLERATGRALYHINTYMHPQVVLVDGTSSEEDYFLRGMRKEAAEYKIPVIELPENAGKRLNWIAKLDSASLTAWNKVHVNVMVHAPPSGSGSFIRLLKSLNKADLCPFGVPHLTIELPQRIEQATEKFMESFQWPPAGTQYVGQPQMLTLRHRIPRKRMNEEESSVRFLESFWPSKPDFSHILVLSHQTEVSPQFFHYVKYALLEYRYSSNALMQGWDRRLLGISMDLPATYLNATETFTAPKPTATLEGGEKRVPNDQTSFLWQAPNSQAMLFMGEKWMELHGFVAQVLEVQQGSSPVPPLLSEKDVSKKYPSWLEHSLRLSRARGYFTLYPSSDTASTVAVVHDDLYQPPEEYATGSKSRDGSRGNREIKLGSSGILDTLPDDGSFEAINNLPLLSWDGILTNLPDMDAASRKYTVEFRTKVGGCSEKEAQSMAWDAAARDLFCKKKPETHKAKEVP